MSETPLTPPSPDSAEPELARVLARIANEDARALLRELCELARQCDARALSSVLFAWDRRLDAFLNDGDRLLLGVAVLEERWGATPTLATLRAAIETRCPPSPPYQPASLDDLLEDLETEARRASKRRVTRPILDRYLTNDRVQAAIDELTLSPWFQGLQARDRLLAELAVIEEIEGVSPETERMRHDIIRLWPPTTDASTGDRG